MFNCDAFIYLVVPASSTINLSVVAKVIPVPSVAPSTWIAAAETLSAVVIVDNKLSPILPANLEAAIEPANCAFVIVPTNELVG